VSLVSLDDPSSTKDRWTTSAGSAMRRVRPVVCVFFVLGPPLDRGTGARVLTEEDWEQFDLCLEPTSSGRVVDTTAEEHAPDAATALMELRRLSGLTWDQLSVLFDVNRRSLHFWASGKALSPTNEEQLRRLLNTIRAIDRGSAKANRAILFEARENRTPFDLLSAGSYDEVVRLVGRGDGRRAIELPPLSAEAREARKPLPPAVLADARQDSVHRSRARGRPARAKKVRRRGRD
jgi:hypothetical protein